MGCSTSKQERSTTMRQIKGKSNEQRRRTTRRELNEKQRANLAMKMAEIEWRKERKRLREEVKKLRQKMEEKEEAKAQRHECEWVVKQICLREEAVERWKKLYFSIKTELNDLIHTTYGEALRHRPQEESAKTMQELKKEVKVSEETIETLNERIALMEKQLNGKEREIDLLRQSLRILGTNNAKFIVCK